ncbi:MAG: GNAT family N-acetyltransferase [Clostridiales bacterium]|nr:GNAT family N-acetyltransferase [Clostridiales bacterium]MDR2750749.1 GNAT family N-acetyltransferase [Clostridiales bacterium]
MARIEPIKTGRLELNPVKDSDAPGIFETRSDPDYGKYTGIPTYQSMEEASSYIQRLLGGFEDGTCFFWSIRSNGSYAGSICLWNISPDGREAELGYDLLKKFRGMGFIQEAIRGVLDFAFAKAGMERVMALPCIENIKSVASLESAGFFKVSQEGLYARYEMWPELYYKGKAQE